MKRLFILGLIGVLTLSTIGCCRPLSVSYTHLTLPTKA